MILPPTRSDVYQAAASFAAATNVLKLYTAHAVKISWHLDLPSHKSKPLRICRGLVQRYDFRNRLARLGNHEGLAVGNLFYQTGQMGLHLVNADGSQRAFLT